MNDPCRRLFCACGLSVVVACGAERFNTSAVTVGGGADGAEAGMGMSSGGVSGTGGAGSGGAGGVEGTGGVDGTGGINGTGGVGSGGVGGAAPPDAPIEVAPGTGGAMVDAPAETAPDGGDAARPDEGDPCALVRADGGVGGGCDCESFGGHAYRFCRTGRAFIAAEAECMAHGMRLIRLDSDAENTWAYGTKTARGMGTTWIGATDAVIEGDWRWVDNTPFWLGRGATAGGTSVAGLYQNWDVKAAEPNQNGNEDCAGYWYQIPTWADLTCTDVNAYICEAY